MTYSFFKPILIFLLIGGSFEAALSKKTVVIVLPPVVRQYGRRDRKMFQESLAVPLEIKRLGSGADIHVIILNSSASRSLDPRKIKISAQLARDIRRYTADLVIHTEISLMHARGRGTLYVYDPRSRKIIHTFSHPITALKDIKHLAAHALTVLWKKDRDTVPGNKTSSDVHRRDVKTAILFAVDLNPTTGACHRIIKWELARFFAEMNRLRGHSPNLGLMTFGRNHMQIFDCGVSQKEFSKHFFTLSFGTQANRGVSAARLIRQAKTGYFSEYPQARGYLVILSSVYTHFSDFAGVPRLIQDLSVLPVCLYPSPVNVEKAKCLFQADAVMPLYKKTVLRDRARQTLFLSRGRVFRSGLTAEKNEFIMRNAVVLSSAYANPQASFSAVMRKEGLVSDSAVYSNTFALIFEALADKFTEHGIRLTPQGDVEATVLLQSGSDKNWTRVTNRQTAEDLRVAFYARRPVLIHARVIIRHQLPVRFVFDPYDIRVVQSAQDGKIHTFAMVRANDRAYSREKSFTFRVRVREFIWRKKPKP